VQKVTLRWIARVSATLALLVAAPVGAVDFDEYARLLQAADAAHTALDEAAGAERQRLLEEAAAADTAIIEWLEAFTATDDFASLGPEQRATIIRGRYRTEYNLAGVLIPLDRCVEARSRVRALLDSELNDPELRPRLVERYDEANECANRARTATLVVFAQPVNANVLVDGVFLGTADVPHRIDLGEHRVTVVAEGHYPQETEIVAEREDQMIQIGPFQLELIPVADTGRPTWYEWTLWGAGVVGLGLGVTYWILYNDIDRDLENPNIDVANREEAEQTRDNRLLGAIVFASVGVVAAIAGTWSYLARQSGDGDSREASGVRFGVGLGSVFLDYRF
jgi:cytochrome c-type biogenesis protein CcmH/NrfF